MNQNVEPENNELNELKTKCEEYLAGWKRAQADYQNLEKEYAGRMSKMAEYAAAESIVRFLPMIDNFELALKHIPKEIEDSEWIKGLARLPKERDELLKTLGIIRIESVGKKFDPHLHEAVGHEPSAEMPDDHIIKEVQVGYRMKDKLIRPARVIVSKGN